jgi:cytochrome c oxidase cbb3-type subunit 3
MSDFEFSSSFWGWFIGIVTVGGILGCIWLVMWMTSKKTGDKAETMGHVWDEDLEELNNPLPGSALKVGERLYLTYCTACHGSDAGGVKGFPNLRDNDWQYGGTPDAIKTSIRDGRVGVMPAWEGPLGGEQGVHEVTQYVLTLSKRAGVDQAAAEAGKPKYMAFCAGCHMPAGTGNQALGAPNLTDNIWLYGGHEKDITHSIAKGRNGRMPAHGEFLGEEKVHLLTAYIYRLSQ